MNTLSVAVCLFRTKQTPRFKDETYETYGDVKMPGHNVRGPSATTVWLEGEHKLGQVELAHPKVILFGFRVNLYDPRVIHKTLG